MKTRSIYAWIASFALSALTAGPANAILIAGWDMSQYISPGGLLDIDGQLPFDGTLLSANYSALDPLQLGPTAGAYGAMYLNGLYGSTEIVPVGDASEPILPTELSLGANLNAPSVGGTNFEFDSLDELRARGQLEANRMKLSLLGPSAVDLVFRANTATLPGTDWVLTFGGRANSANTNVTVQYSLTGDPASYMTVGGPVTFTTAEAPFTVALTAAQSPSMFVRLRFDASGQANLDNVALNATIVPEPGTALLLAASLAGLAACRRRWA
jgi:hypothetical protein